MTVIKKFKIGELVDGNCMQQIEDTNIIFTQNELEDLTRQIQHCLDNIYEDRTDRNGILDDDCILDDIFIELDKIIFGYMN